jgi:hypothetical protein
VACDILKKKYNPNTKALKERVFLRQQRPKVPHRKKKKKKKKSERRRCKGMIWSNLRVVIGALALAQFAWAALFVVLRLIDVCVPTTVKLHYLYPRHIFLSPEEEITILFHFATRGGKKKKKKLETRTLTSFRNPPLSHTFLYFLYPCLFFIFYFVCLLFVGFNCLSSLFPSVALEVPSAVSFIHSGSAFRCTVRP